ncbi:uncharacterized protein [Argopecten irradians]|uniref:uncharacterized protein n=1 Tax=Argopecten irradians TaxID=31199 RepID=UPI0037151734
MNEFSIMRGQQQIAQLSLMDYAAGMAYTVSEGTCTKTKLTGPFQPFCIPDSAPPAIPMYFGTGDNKINVMNYVLADPAGIITSLLVSDGCVPFSNTTINMAGASPYALSLGYNGTTIGIKDPSVFDVPAECKHDTDPVRVARGKMRATLLKNLMQPEPIKVDPVQQAPRKCCFPQKFQSPGGMIGLVETGGKTYFQSTNLNISYDATLQKQATVSQTSINESPPTIEIELKDYRDGVQYNVRNGKCFKNPLKSPMPNCIPDDATYEPMVMGSGATKLKGGVYTYTLHGIKVTDFVTDDCVLISQILNGNVGPTVEYWYTLGYSALTLGIKDEKVFDVPATCKNATEVENARLSVWQI